MPEVPDDLAPDSRELLSEIMAAHGYDSLRPTQQQAFTQGILEGGNHLLVAETGNGKTLCAEAVTKQTLDAGGQVAYLVPSHNLVSDKHDELSEWTGDQYTITNSAHGGADILLTTFDAFFSAMLRGSESITGLDRVVLDDFHILYDRRRGSSLEKAIAATRENNIPIFAMSATLGNPEELAEWLDANLIVSDEDRGIEIVEQPIEVDDARERKRQVADVVEGHQDTAPFLVFNSSRAKCEARAEEVADRRVFADAPDRRIRSELRSQVETTLTSRLKDLAAMMEQGVAYHHAGLPRAVRNWIEECFREGDIQAIFCTPTLAYGFDSPVQSVVVSELKRYESAKGYQTYVGTWEYVQWIGRAARPGMGYDQGYAYPLYSDFDAASERFFGDRELERVTTHMDGESQLRWLLLELVEMGWQTRSDLEAFMQETLLWHQLNVDSSWSSPGSPAGSRSDPRPSADTTDDTNPYRMDTDANGPSQTADGPPARLEKLRAMLAKEATWLQDYGFLRERPVEDGFEPTELGSAAVEFNFSTWRSHRLRDIHHFCRRLEEYSTFEAMDLLREVAVLEDVYLSADTIESDFEEKLASAGLDPNDDGDRIAGALGWYWCQNIPLDSIEEATGVDGTAVSMQARGFSQTLEGASELFQALDVDQPPWYDDLAASVEKGVPRDELPIARNVDGVGRAKIRSLGEYLETASKSDDMAVEVSASTVVGRLSELYLSAAVTSDQFEAMLRSGPDGIGKVLAERLVSFVDTFVDEQGYVGEVGDAVEGAPAAPPDGWYQPEPLFGSHAVTSSAGDAPGVVGRPTSLDEWQ